MSYKVKMTPGFDSASKQIAKKHKGIKADIKGLIDDLEKNPQRGTHLGDNVYKIRLAISGTNKGKSGGARVITYVVVLSEVVYLAEIYLKNENDTVDRDTVVKRLKDAGVI